MQKTNRTSNLFNIPALENEIALEKKIAKKKKIALENKIALPAPEKEMIRDFYHRTISRFAGQHLPMMKEEVRFIVVGHLVPTLPFYLEALNKIGTIAAVIKKGSVPDDDITDWLKEWLPAQTNDEGVIVDQLYFEARKNALLEIVRKFSSKKSKHLNLPVDKEGKLQEEKLGTRELLAVNGPELIREWVGKKKGILIDIGGYFAPILKDLPVKTAETVGVIGIVEDTENGHQLYEQAIDTLTRKESRSVPPIITVARSQIKDSEDYNVGKAITDAVDHILRTAEYTHLAESKTILIIGYGKIGSAAAKVASEKTRGSVLICEIDPVRRLKASAHSFAVVSLEKGLAKAGVIICCTGNKCLTNEHLHMIKNNAYIASCTSRDGEFDETFLINLNKTKGYEENGKVKQASEAQQQSVLPGGDKTSSKNEKSHITRYTIAGKTINLLNNGNSVNFVEKAVHGYFIHGVLASLASAAIRLYLDSPFGSTADRHVDKVLKNGELNDFNALISAKEGLHYQSVIADILMQEKLRKGPILTNYQRSSARYLPRDKYVRKLNRLLNEQGGERAGRVHITGGKKYGKSQIVEEFFALHSSRYDIVWKFDALSPLDAQFRQFALTINRNAKIISKIEGKIEFIKIQEGVSPARRHRNSPKKSDQVLLKVKDKQIQEKLGKSDLSYLLIFEDIDLLSEAEGLSIDSLQSHLPNSSKSRREHIIFTSGDKLDLKADFARLALTPFPTVELFKFLINDEAIWAGKETELGRLAYAFVYPTSPLDGYEGGEIPHQDKGYDIFVAVSNVFAAFMRNHKNYDWQELIYERPGVIRNSPPEGGHINHFLNVVLSHLDEATKKLLLLFYVINFEGVVCSLDRDELIKFLRKGSVDSTLASKVDTLLEYGLIEEKNGRVSPVLTHISEQNSSDELLELIQNNLDESSKQGLETYKGLYKKFIVDLTVKQFCHDYDSQVPLLPMVEKIAGFFRKPEKDNFYYIWKKKYGKLYRTLLKELGDFYLESSNHNKSTRYYKIVEKEYSLLLEGMRKLIIADVSKQYPVAQEECRQIKENTEKKLKKIKKILSSMGNDDVPRQVGDKSKIRHLSIYNTPKVPKHKRYRSFSTKANKGNDRVQRNDNPNLGRWSISIQRKRKQINITSLKADKGIDQQDKGQEKRRKIDSVSPEANKGNDQVQRNDRNARGRRNLSKVFEEVASTD